MYSHMQQRLSGHANVSLYQKHMTSNPATFNAAAWALLSREAEQITDHHGNNKPDEDDVPYYTSSDDEDSSHDDRTPRSSSSSTRGDNNKLMRRAANFQMVLTSYRNHQHGDTPRTRIYPELNEIQQHAVVPTIAVKSEDSKTETKTELTEDASDLVSVNVVGSYSQNTFTSADECYSDLTTIRDASATLSISIPDLSCTDI